ncbi:MAG TPA: GAF domain-containing protein [Chloroflexota bacterium]|nr:GAF domain-containing protein [Chloroflexota bacterium]
MENTLLDLRRQVAELSAVLMLEQDLTIGSASTDTVLGIVLERVARLLGVGFVGVMLYDPERAELVLQRPARGIEDEWISRCHFPPSKGVSGGVFRSGEPFLSNSVPDESKVLPGCYIRHYGFRNLICLPIDVDGSRIGVFLAASKVLGAFAPDDLQLASLIATRLGLVIQNARLLESQQQTIDKLAESHHTVDSQRESLQRSLAIQDNLVRMVLDGQSLQSIAAALGRLVANPVAIHDRFANLIAYFEPADNVRLGPEYHHAIAAGNPLQLERDEASARPMLAHLGQERRPVRVSPAPSLGTTTPLVVAPIVVGQETVGSLYVVESNRSLDELDFAVVDRAAIAIALHMMKEEAATEAQYPLRSDLVRELLGGNGSSEVLLRRAAVLGIDLRIPRVVLLLGIDETTQQGIREQADVETVARHSQLLDAVERASRKSMEGTLIAEMDDEIVILSPIRVPGKADGTVVLRELASQLHDAVQLWLPDTSVSIGIGSCCHSMDDYPRSYEQARSALNVARASRQRNHIQDYSEFGILGLLVESRNRNQLDFLVNDALGDLLEYDRRHSSDLTRTLEAYLANDCHLERTSADLSIHISTLRYRLHRIEQITKAELRNGDKRLNLQLALKVLRMLDTVKEANSVIA